MFVSDSLIKITDLIAYKPHSVQCQLSLNPSQSVYTHTVVKLENVCICQFQDFLSLQLAFLILVFAHFSSICTYLTFFSPLNRILFFQSFRYLLSSYILALFVCFCFNRKLLFVYEMRGPGVDTELRIDQIWWLKECALISFRLSFIVRFYMVTLKSACSEV